MTRPPDVVYFPTSGGFCHCPFLLDLFKLTTALFLLRAAQLGIPIRDLELLTIGMVTDMLIEAGNDGAEYDMLPTQEDFDAF